MRVETIVTEARAHLSRCLLERLRSEGWKTRLTPGAIIDRHLKPERHVRSARREHILERMILSAQNRQAANNVIVGSVKEGAVGLRALLLNYDADAILARWRTADELFNDIARSHRVRGEKRETSRSLWPKFCKSVMSAARFVAKFKSGHDFRRWAEKFRDDPDRAAALPLILAEEVDGYGVALACDFLKEIGYVEYLKPDVHVRRLAHGLGLSNAQTDYMLLRDLMKLDGDLKAAGLNLYAFDKYLWLIGSGRFYRHIEDNAELAIDSQTEPFLAHMREVRKPSNTNRLNW